MSLKTPRAGGKTKLHLGLRTKETTLVSVCAVRHRHCRSSASKKAADEGGVSVGSPEEDIRRQLIFVFLTPFTIGWASRGCSPEEKSLTCSRSFMQLFPTEPKRLGNGTGEWDWEMGLGLGNGTGEWGWEMGLGNGSQRSCNFTEPPGLPPEVQNEPLNFSQSILRAAPCPAMRKPRAQGHEDTWAAARQVQEDVTVPGKVLSAGCLSFPSSEMGLTGAPTKGTETTS